MARKARRVRKSPEIAIAQSDIANRMEKDPGFKGMVEFWINARVGKELAGILQHAAITQLDSRPGRTLIAIEGGSVGSAVWAKETLMGALEHARMRVCEAIDAGTRLDRTCQTLHRCALCGCDITIGQQYRGDRTDHRAHEECFRAVNKEVR